MPVTLHYIIYDARGGCILVEYNKGHCNIYDNPTLRMIDLKKIDFEQKELKRISMSRTGRTIVDLTK
jgi:hypothetical protein